MSISRRDCLKLGALGGGAAMLGGCANLAGRIAQRPERLALPTAGAEENLRLVHRTTFGPRPGDVARAKALGKEGYVDSLLKAGEDEEPRLQFLLNRLDVFQMDAYETQELPENEVLRQLQAAALLRAVYGRHQLRERMVDFSTNHFNIYSRKGLSAFRKATDETKVVRQHALDTFPNLLKASAHSPAMLMFLDNQGNTSGHPNENYAREIMELHSLGVKGGYTQKDVQEVARCFTGWTIERRFLRHRWTFRFDPDLHDNGTKRVLGHTIPGGGGEKDADIVLQILSTHPSTAHFIASKLCAAFLGADGGKWTDQTAQTYLNTGGDIRAMLRPLLLSKDLIDSPPILKRPFDLIASSLRALDADTDGGKDVQNHLEKMGEPLYQWPMPDGYPTKTSAWTGSMLPRWNFAHQVASGAVGGTRYDSTSLKEPEVIYETLLGSRPASSGSLLLDSVAREIKNHPEDSTSACFLCLASPEFQWR